MAEAELGKLVQQAKGEDRSLREYARDSGVDAAVISKIINGTYVPKKLDVYKSLTSQDASPRGGVTYEQLVKAIDPSSSYMAGVLAGMAILGIGKSMIKQEKSSSRKKKPDKVERVINEIKHFSVLSNGLIFGSLASKGIAFQITDKGNFELENQFNTYLKLEGQGVKEYILGYLYLSEERQKDKYLCQATPRQVMKEFFFLEPSADRKVSIVTNCAASYDYMLSYKNRVSFNGELSIILVDTEQSKLLKEDYISHYAGNNAPGELKIV